MSDHNGDSGLALELEVTHRICEAINSPRSLAVDLLARNGEWDQLLALEVDPSQYSSAHRFSQDYLCSKILSKSVQLPTGYDKAAKALAAFHEGESLCRETNKRLLDTPLPAETRLLVHKVARQVERIAGPLNRRALRFIESEFRHGPGATFNMRGTGSVRSEKYRHRPSLTGDLIPFARSIMGDRWADLHPFFEVVDGNRFTTVPKSCKTDRGICIEPTLNVFAQLGVGTYLKSRLKRFGCDLYDQSWNQFLASKAMSWSLATIDLSLASDTVSIGLVSKLLPIRWVELLDLLRSKSTTFPDGTSVPLEKFSSMGNGFTFEVESLIFYALCRAIVPKDEWCFIGVYGDDIIVPQAYAGEVVRALETLGFKPNSSKSHLAGEFFESCGTDWFKDFPVVPFYLRQDSMEIPYALQIANHLRLWSERVGVLGYCDDTLKPIWLWLVYHKIPKRFRIFVPKSAGDVGVNVSWHEARKRLHPVQK